MPSLCPLRFQPIFRRYIWGGRRLETSLGKQLPPGNDWAESWEIVDHGADQSVVVCGELAGITLEQLIDRHGRSLLGRHHPQKQFPLLLKFLDAARTLSVQVHPDDARAAKLNPPDFGKTEAWVVLAAEPGSELYAGLKPGVDRRTLADAVREGRCQDCLHVLQPRPGDCVFVPAGVVHALGAGLLVAELQQSSNVTYRLFDWNRVGPDGKPRALHVEQALDAIDFSRGPVEPQRPRLTDRPQVARLVECEKFVLDRWQFDTPLNAGGDDRCHIITVLQGGVRIDGDPADCLLSRGGTALLPAELGLVRLVPESETVLLDGYLP
ncbi:MAG: type I phosphomannose isomerase catalytic subunit [Thermoguttaceae bacterium]